MHDRWTITRAEFDGWFAKLAPDWRSTAGALLMVGGLATLAAILMTTAKAASVQYLIPVLALLGVVALVRATRRIHHLHRSAARIWDAGGAVCPKCHETLRDQACAHGLTCDDADTARSYWEAAVRGDAAATSHASATLAQRETPRGALGRPLAGWKRMRRWAAASVFDPRKPLWLRLVSAVLGFGLTLVVVLSVFEWAARGITPTPLGVALTMLRYGLMCGGMIIGITACSGTRAGRNHCTACNHLIADGHETRPCTECGADLTKPGAVGSGELQRDTRSAVIGGAIGVAAFLAPFVLGTTLAAQLLPTRVLMLQYAAGSDTVRYGITLEMSRRPLDAVTTSDFADMLIDAARTESPSALDHSSFVGSALLSRKIGADTACRALRASVAVRIDAPDRVRAGEPFQTTVVPVFGTDLFQLTHSTAVAWEDLEIDHEAQDKADGQADDEIDDEIDDQTVGEASGRKDGRPLGAAPRFFTEFDMNPARSAPVRPTPLTVTLDARGERMLRVRAWIVLLPLGTQRKAPVFDAEGRLVAPEGAVAATEIVVEKAVLVE